jgi:hypothetical protein
MHLLFLLGFPHLFPFLPHPNLLEVLQRARPSYNPRETFPRWADSPSAQSETKLCTKQFQSTRKVEKRHKKKASVCCTHKSVCSTFLQFSGKSFPPFPTSWRSCNGPAPLLIQEGRARAGQKVHPSRVGQNS